MRGEEEQKGGDERRVEERRGEERRGEERKRRDRHLVRKINPLKTSKWSI